MVDGQPDHGLEIVEPVSGVIATAAEDDAVHASSGLGGLGPLLQRIGQLDLVAATGGVLARVSKIDGSRT